MRIQFFIFCLFKTSIITSQRVDRLCMKISQETIDNFSLNYPLETIAPLEKILFLDIETTGFAVQTSNLYLIGCAYYSSGKWHTIQWFAEKYAEEVDILDAFFEFAKNYKFAFYNEKVYTIKFAI